MAKSRFSGVARSAALSASPRMLFTNTRRQARRLMDRAGMVILITLTSMASLIPLAVGTSTQDIFGAIALATAGGTIFGTLGAMFVVPALLVGKRQRRPGPHRSSMDVSFPDGVAGQP